VEFATEAESIRIGASYFSDLLEADDLLVDREELPYENRIPAWSAYALIGFESFEITAEIVRANGAITELDSEFNKPSSWNLELAFFPSQWSQVALRVEHSSELEEQPEWKYGLASTWRPGEHVTLTVEYLYGTFKSGFAMDDDEGELTHSQQIAAQLSFEF